MRTYALGELVPGQTLEHPTQLAVEWGGQHVGHPSTYGLLGGELGAAFQPELDPKSGEVHDQLGYKSVPALFGLSDDYRRAIESTGLRTVTVAAEHSHCSSQMVSRFLAAFLLWGLERGGWPANEDEVWDKWDSVRREVIAGLE